MELGEVVHTFNLSTQEAEVGTQISVSSSLGRAQTTTKQTKYNKYGTYKKKLSFTSGNNQSMIPMTVKLFSVMARNMHKIGCYFKTLSLNAFNLDNIV